MSPQPNDVQQLSEKSGKLVSRRVEDIQPHPSFLRHHLSVSLAELSVVVDAGRSFQQPLEITQENMILSGYAQWEVARRQNWATVPCLQYELEEAEALQWLLRRHRRSNGLNAFARALLALDLEPWLHSKARLNQQLGGHAKGSSKLAEAERLDVRSEIARSAGVSAGNIAKVKQLLASAHEDIFAALRANEISIHRAWLWCRESPEKQREGLTRRRGELGVRKRIRQLISKQQPERPQPIIDAQSLTRSLRAIDLDSADLITVSVIDAPGNGIFVTKKLFNTLSTYQQELALCDMNNR
jgi:hypothetical protein